MFAVLVALVVLFAGVAAIYLLLKNMSEEGIDIAAPGSCRRGRCGKQSRPLIAEAEEAPQHPADADAGDKPKT